MPRTKKKDEHRAIVDLCALESVSSDWESTEVLARRAGIRHHEAMWAALRLAAAGVIERREVSWRSARCRTRVRSEYRLPFIGNCMASAQWSIFPAWLVPPMQAEPDPEFIRRIYGRHTDLTEDAVMISDIELNELPRGVRERFRDLKDSAFTRHPKVVEAQTRLDEHHDRHADCVEQVSAVKERIEQLQTQQRNARVELQAVADGRKKVIAEALLAGDDLSADQVARERCARLEHLIEAIDLGMPTIRRKLDQLLEATRTVAISLQADEDHLRGVLDELKLAEAQRQYAL